MLDLTWLLGKISEGPLCPRGRGKRQQQLGRMTQTRAAQGGSIATSAVEATAGDVAEIGSITALGGAQSAEVATTAAAYRIRSRCPRV